MPNDQENTKIELIEDVYLIYRRTLKSDWEIYKTPYLNGLTPDLALLHPGHGICLILIEQLELSNPSLRDEGQSLQVIIDETPDKTTTHKIPLPRLEKMRREMEMLYGFRLASPVGGNIQPITIGVLYPNLAIDMSNIFQRLEQKKYALFCLTGKQIIGNPTPSALVPQLRNESHPVIEPEVIADLRNWLAPQTVRVGHRRLFSPQQRDIDNSENTPKRRRLRGGPGTGKSEVLCSRAARLASAGKKVLFLTYNITLLNELRERFNGYVLEDTKTDRSGEGKTHQAKATFLNFHSWITILGATRGKEEEIAKIWRENINFAAQDDAPKIVSEAVQNDPLTEEELFDAVFIDEAQDMTSAWIKMAAGAVRKEGEFYIAADLSQNIYKRTQKWTDQDLNGLGFRGRWTELKSPYRSPNFLVPFLNKFADKFNLGEKCERLEVGGSIQRKLNDLIRWKISEESDLAKQCIGLIHELVEHDNNAKQGPADVAISSIVILVDVKKRGVEIAQELVNRGISLASTFPFPQRDRLPERCLKLEFSTRQRDVKISTIHSFKGFGTERLVVVIGNKSDPVLVFAALSRIKDSPLGHSLYVISSNQNINHFAREWSATNGVDFQFSS